MDYLDGVPTLYWLVGGDVGEESVRVVDLGHQETDPARRGQTRSVQIFTLGAPETAIFY